ncbi:AlbA family DNA-binding domain-containing protein [Ramlibacter alkalitolerans]|uniref:ATP-binding protein n=1 Tax=Ramlibacter alkalitolerans TaxID=2039631 RepID=A0ABS1JKW0_9BURK|nr:ATP-binding protein [Ramlibacter alkalitolerans]MBL0424865.1 ATP-binding protein [Ramlibacter alkalitolerans]
MNPIPYQDAVPLELRQQLQSTWSNAMFSRRAVAVRDTVTQSWVLLGCVLRPERSASMPPAAQCFAYEDALLSVDWMTAAECEAFLDSLVTGVVRLAGTVIAINRSPGCESQRVAIQNSWMDEPGVVFTLRPRIQPNPYFRRLLLRGAPYYPDPYEAARDWLRLREYHRETDARKGHFMVLLPETRAFIKSFEWRNEQELALEVIGPAAQSSQLFAKGAYWCGHGIDQFEVPVQGSTAVVNLPQDVQRLELFLLGADGTVFEHHLERIGDPGATRFLGGRRAGESHRVHHALREGEGVRIEFKEFVDLPKHREPVKDKDKLHQVLRTVAAFANTEGGTLFIGISDDCRVVGVDEFARVWTQAPLEQALEAYAGALRTRIRDAMQAPLAVSTSSIGVDDRVVLALDVPRSPSPVSLKSDGRLYERRGASNIAVPPAEWRRRWPSTP